MQEEQREGQDGGIWVRKLASEAEQRQRWVNMI